MQKTKIETWLAPDEIAEITRLAKALKMSRSEYVRLCALNGFSKTESPASSPESPELQNSLADLQSQIAELRGAFHELISQISELVRIPTFREFRARFVAEGGKTKSNEEVPALLEVAELYFARYGVWPDPAKELAFGQISEQAKQRWPRK